MFKNSNALSALLSLILFVSTAVLTMDAQAQVRTNDKRDAFAGTEAFPDILTPLPETPFHGHRPTYEVRDPFTVVDVSRGYVRPGDRRLICQPDGFGSEICDLYEFMSVKDPRLPYYLSPSDYIDPRTGLRAPLPPGAPIRNWPSWRRVGMPTETYARKG